MARFLIYSAVLCASWFFPVYAGEVKIEAVAKDFANQELVFFIYEDPFFDKEKEIARIPVSADGSFSLNFETENTWSLYVEMGPYLAYFYTEPGYNYKIEFPEINRLPEDWKFNPYFQKVPFHIKVHSAEHSYRDNGEITELNQAIRMFDREFDPFQNKQILRYYNPVLSAEKRDSFINKIYAGKAVSDMDYYDSYINAKKAILEFNVSDHNLDSLISYYIQPVSISFQNPAYRELFRLLYDDYFDHLSKKENFRKLFNVFSTFDYTEIKSYAQKDPALKNDSTFNLVLLHETYKAYYSNLYDKKSILRFIENFSNYTTHATATDISSLLYARFTNTGAGFPAPSFILNDINGNTLSLDSLKGKYILLGFCNTSSTDCLREFEYLKYLNSKHSQYLKIITIIPSAFSSGLPGFAKQNSFNWSMVSSSGGDKLMKDYGIKAMPVFYLIGKNGELILSPSLNPSEGLEHRLFLIIRDAGDYEPSNSSR